MIPEVGRVKGKFIINRYRSPDYRAGLPPYDRSEFGNVLLNEGITRVINLIVGGGGTSYSSGNAALGVGDSTASSGVATSTGLLSTANTLYVATSSITISGQSVTWRSVFSSVQANYNWREFTVRNSVTATGANENLNRAVSNQGTKASGQTWTLDLQITFS